MGLTAVKNHATWLVRALCSWRNPLCRPLDRIAAALTFLLLIVAVLATIGTVPLGNTLHSRFAAQAAHAAATIHPTAAVVATDPQPLIASTVGGQPDTQGSATVRWTAANGAHSAMINVPLDSQPGQQVTIWTNQYGQLAPVPSSPVMVNWSTIFVTAATLLVTLLACALLIMGAQGLARYCGQRSWGREWETMQRWGSWSQR